MPYDLSYQLVGIAFSVHRQLGGALPECCYRDALVMEFIEANIDFTREAHYDVIYKGQKVGSLRPDIVIEDKIVLELKSVDQIYPSHIAQLMAYLSVTGHKVGYILNFGTLSLQYKRLIM